MKSWLVNFQLYLVVLVLVAILLPQFTWGASRRIIELRSSKIDGPPVRPKQFDSVEELNQYLADLAEYYKMMGRPRFGKRSYDGPQPYPQYTDSKSSKYSNLWKVIMDNVGSNES